MAAERMLTSRSTQIRVNTGTFLHQDLRAMVSIVIASETITQAILDSIIAIAEAAWDCSDFPIGDIKMSEVYRVIEV